MIFFYKYKKYFILSGAFILLFVFTIAYIYPKLNNSIEKPISDLAIKDEVTTKISNQIYVDVKGSVKKPGVYKFDEGAKIIDAVNMAGGLSKNGVTTNINLSKKLTNEMVVYIFSKKEITTKQKTENVIIETPCVCEEIEVNNCAPKEDNVVTTTTEPTEKQNTLVNINSADVDTLTTITGIGESKAKAIILYREQNGLFKTIDDLKNVSGIGDSLFAKIKDYIKV